MSTSALILATIGAFSTATSFVKFISYLDRPRRKRA